MVEQRVLVKAIVETLGAPKEYIEEALKQYIDKIKKEGTKILTEVYHNAVPAEHKLFSTYVELEVEFSELGQVLNFCFDSMPSSVEIVEPTDFNLNNLEFNSFLNDLQAKIHETDMLVKNFRAKSRLMELNTGAVFNNFLIYLIRQGPKSLSELSLNVGIQQDELKPFVEELIEKNRVKVEQDKYVVV